MTEKHLILESQQLNNLVSDHFDQSFAELATLLLISNEIRGIKIKN